MNDRIEITVVSRTEDEPEVTVRQPSVVDPHAIVITVPDDIEPYLAEQEQDAIKASKLRQQEESKKALLTGIERTLATSDFVNLEDLKAQCEPFGLWPEVWPMVLKAQAAHKVRQMFDRFED